MWSVSVLCSGCGAGSFQVWVECGRFRCYVAVVKLGVFRFGPKIRRDCEQLVVRISLQYGLVKCFLCLIYFFV